MTEKTEKTRDPETVLSGVSVISGSGVMTGDLLSDDSIRVRPEDPKDPKTWRSPEILIRISGDWISDRLERLSDILERLETLSLSETETETDQTLTLDQSLGLSLGQIIYYKYGYNADHTPMRYRINGKIQTWIRSPDRIKIPLKRGLYEYGYLTEDNLDHFSLSESFAKLDHNQMTERDRIIRDLERLETGVFYIWSFLSDHIRDLRSDRGHHSISEDLTPETGYTADMIMTICLGLRSYMERLIRDLKTADPETLETLRSSHTMISDIFGDPETWKDSDNLTPEILTRVSDSLSI